MTVLINLPAQTEKLLKEKAARAGQTLEAYLRELAEREATATHGTEPNSTPVSAEQWSAQWRAWANQERQLPAGIVMDDSRESIYAERSE
jgi:phosphohistidine phosphatase SixA